MIENLKVVDIRSDGGTQMRASISRETVASYAEHISEGDQFPPVVVFYDGSSYWLADGFHRYHAHQEAGLDAIDAEVHSGQRVDAIRFALKANATNGRPRTSDDMRRAYAVAVSNDLCDGSDTSTVKALLGCSDRWARELTKKARETVKSERDSKIAQLADQGKSQREIAKEVGVSGGLVSKVTSDHKRNYSENDHPEQEANKEPDQSTEQVQPQSRGVGVRVAHEAIAVLKRIPLNDGLRQDAFDMVQDWIKTNRSN